MLHHVSFSVRDPAKCAAIVAELVAGQVLDAPCPPFPTGSRFVLLHDQSGALIELTPWGSVLDPGQRGIGQDPEMRPHSASHILIGTPLASQAVLTAAGRHGLRAISADAGLFRLIKVWIEDSLLLELLPPEHAADYIDSFGPGGAAALNHRLRELEQSLATRGRAT